MERRHYPGVSRERKSIVSGNAHHHYPIAVNIGTLSSEDTPLTCFVFFSCCLGEPVAHLAGDGRRGRV